MRIFGIIAGLMITVVHAQDSVSVLFIGNSYTYVNDLPSLFANLSAAMGKTTTVDSRTQGGATFSVHANNASSYDKINERAWDYVVLQGQSQEPSFPDNQVDQQSIPPAMQLADSVYANHFCSELMLFMTWGYVNGDAQWAPISTYEGMQQRLRDGYSRIADSCQASVAPVGMAWKYTREHYPTINLYSADGSHPSLEGSYLAACTFYAAIFRESPVGASYTAGLDVLTADQLQNAAAAAVLDSLDLWHLRDFQHHTIADFESTVTNGLLITTNTSWKAQNYAWNFGDGNTSGEEHPQHLYLNDGVYDVTLIATSECNSDTLEVMHTIAVLSADALVRSGISLKTINDSTFELIVPKSIASGGYQLFNSAGQLVGSTEINETVAEVYITIYLQAEPSGVYFLHLGNGLSVKLVKR